MGNQDMIDDGIPFRLAQGSPVVGRRWVLLHRMISPCFSLEAPTDRTYFNPETALAVFHCCCYLLLKCGQRVSFCLIFLFSFPGVGLHRRCWLSLLDLLGWWERRRFQRSGRVFTGYCLCLFLSPFRTLPSASFSLLRLFL